jgi:hypothetical protein
MPDLERTILFQANNDLEQIFDRMSRNCEAALEIIQDIELDDLSAQSRERLCDRVHTIREIVRVLSPGFENKLMVETEKLGRGLSPDEVRCLLYGIPEL